ncbi:molybdopterin molybdotransferase MoeA [Croceicoccus naphthovorans]|uniref:molybdopterin molybdotransferase MoeA n=1 Tax=Croceicoccus naphthovorans TaxID=1348774 RepID=UPI00069EE1C3|nr:molybdopterin molybdotransferase MoeA [Croceicoccus naphthovorans]MBB3990874.1 molybdopterin molybdotransferase [Croceicoccus naphthovorans]
MKALLSLEEAQRRLLDLAKLTPSEQLPVEATLGRYLAAPVKALRTQPASPLSAMDGWAIRAHDMPGPWRIVGESAAGHPYKGTVAPTQTVRISTGALLPDDADAVLVQEDCTADGDTLRFAGEPPEPLDRHVRKAGLDFSKAEQLLGSGSRMSPARMALAISGGHATVSVHRQPQVAVIDSGDELALPGTALAPGAIPASNGPMLAALCAQLTGNIRRIGPVPDRIEALSEAMEQARDADILITSGGASVGDHDLLAPALKTIGADVDFWRVAIKPGKPIMVATRGPQVVLGLPGNPVSAFVTAHLFALPLLRAMQGAGNALPVGESWPSSSALPATGKRAEFLRGRFGPDGVAPVSVQDSGALVPLANADCLIVRPAASAPVASGEPVSVIRI